MPKSIHDVDSILQEFQSLEDPRVNVNRRHLLGDLIVICIMAVIAGADGPLAIGTWAENNKQWLTKRLQFSSRSQAPAWERLSLKLCFVVGSKNLFQNQTASTAKKPQPNSRRSTVSRQGARR